MAMNRRERHRNPVGHLGGLIALGILLSAGLASCERKPAAIGAQPAAERATAEKPPREIKLTARMKVLATQPAGGPTGLFIDRQSPGDLRVVSYNVNWDKIFPETDAGAAEKFQRVIKALDPDILNLQEIRQNDAGAVVALMNAIDPRPAGRTWHAHKGATNVIVSRFPLKQTADRTAPSASPLRDPACALVDLPDHRFAVDVYVLNSHFKCCGGTENDPKRQKQADALVNWIRDGRTAGGEFDLPAGTPILIVGDLNLVGGPQPLATLLTGDIINEDTYGEDFAPDWDDSELTDAHPLHNAVGPDDYTWRNDDDRWDPGRLDYIIYTDNVLEEVHGFVLNTTTMTDEELARARLEKFDVTLDLVGRHFDHLPVVVDFRLTAP